MIHPTTTVEFTLSNAMVEIVQTRHTTMAGDVMLWRTHNVGPKPVVLTDGADLNFASGP